MKGLFVIIFFCCRLSGYAQIAGQFLNFNSNNGLSQNSVHAIYRDHDGLVWLGTQDGLNSFDGKNFTIYKPQANDSTSLSDQFVLSIREDNDGFLWVGTRYGLNKLDKRTGKFTRFFISESEKSSFQSSYTDVVPTTKRSILFSWNQKLYMMNTRSNKISSLQYSGGRNYAFADDSLAIWYFNPEKGIFKVAGNNAGLPQKIGDTFTGHFSLGQVIATGNGKDLLAFGTHKSKVFIFNKKTFHWLPEIQLNSKINCLYFNINDSLFAGTDDGIYVIEGGKIVQYITNRKHESNSLPPGAILSVFQDSHNNLWAGTSSSGFVLYSQNFRNTQIIKPGLVNSNINAVAEDDVDIWLGTLNGLFRYNKQLGKAVAVQSSLSGKNITALTIDANNNIWLGINQEGLWKTDKSGNLLQKFTTGNSVLKTMQVLHLTADKEGRVFISTENGFYIFSDEAIVPAGLYEVPISEADGRRTGHYILHSYCDKDKNIWLSTNSRVIVFDKNLKLIKSIASSSDTNPIKRTLITGITQDHLGTMWIGTISKGIYSLNQRGQLTNYNTGYGLGSDVISSVETDNRGRIWATTSDGLYVFDTTYKQFFRLTQFYGVPSATFSSGSLYRSSTGKIYACSSAGLLIFNADSITLYNQSVSAKITDIKINGISIEKMSRPFLIKAYNKIISFQLGISEVFQLGNVIYQYRLTGVDKEWQTLPSGSNSISYNNLPYSKLNMQVRAASSLTALQSAPVESFIIENTAPFWQTTWFMFLCLTGILGAALFILQRYNSRKYLKQQQWIKSQEQLRSERERIAQDLHDNIGAYAAALITGFSRLESSQHEEKVHRQLGDLKDYASSILTNLRETIWVLHQPSLTIEAFAERFQNYVFKISKQYPGIDISIEQNISDNRRLAPRAALNIFRILQEALHNVFKHADASKVEVIFYCDTYLKVSVQDNGKGIMQNKQEDSFGLKNMQARADDIGFLLAIYSISGEGTHIELKENTANAASV